MKHAHRHRIASTTIKLILKKNLVSILSILRKLKQDFRFGLEFLFFKNRRTGKWSEILTVRIQDTVLFPNCLYLTLYYQLMLQRHALFLWVWW